MLGGIAVNTDSAARRGDDRSASRALVLSGGGALGIAWEAGLIVGFAEGGVVLADADLIVGTSAGSLVGAHLALGLDPADALDTVAAFAAALGAAQSEVDPRALFGAMAEAATGESPEQGRRVLGRMAVEAKTIDEERFVGLAPQLDGRGWPSGYACAAVAVETGTLRVWDSGTGVPLARAVASSCAAPMSHPSVTIGGRRYMDGGERSNLNADLAAGQERVVAVSARPLRLPEDVGDPMLSAWAASAEAELDTVRGGWGGRGGDRAGRGVPRPQRRSRQPDGRRAGRRGARGRRASGPARARPNPRRLERLAARQRSA